MSQSNKMTIFNVYTDASYSKEVGGTVIGYSIRCSSSQQDFGMTLEFLDQIKNTEGEMIATDRAIQKCKEMNPNCHINLYTDCQKATKLEIPNVTFHKVVGHSKKSEKDEHDFAFSIVDRAARKRLREMFKNKKSG